MCEARTAGPTFLNCRSPVPDNEVRHGAHLRHKRWSGWTCFRVACSKFLTRQSFQANSAFFARRTEAPLNTLYEKNKDLPTSVWPPVTFNFGSVLLALWGPCRWFSRRRGFQVGVLGWDRVRGGSSGAFATHRECSPASSNALYHCALLGLAVKVSLWAGLPVSRGSRGQRGRSGG